MSAFNPHFQNSAPTRYGFGPYARITVSDPTPQHYVQKSRDAHVIVLTPVAEGDILRPLKETPPETYMQAEFGALVDRKKVDVDPHFFNQAKKRLIALNPKVDSLQDLPKEELSYIDFTFRLIILVESKREEAKASLSDRALWPLIASAHAELCNDQASEEEPNPRGSRGTVKVPKRIAPSTFRGYLRRLIAFDFDMMALRDGRTARACHRPNRINDPAVVQVMAKWVRAFLDSKRPSPPVLYQGMVHEFQELNATRSKEGAPPLKIPSPSTFRRRIAKLAPYEVCLAREGPSAARRQFKLAARNEVAIAPGDRVTMDSWNVNVRSLKLPDETWAGMPEDWQEHFARLRLKLCIAVDEASKIYLGARVAINPSTETSVKTLEMVCRDKSRIAESAGCVSTWHHCVQPTYLPTDGGSEFRQEFRAVARDAGGHAFVGPAGSPDARAIVERAFRTIDEQLMQHFTGRTGTALPVSVSSPPKKPPASRPTYLQNA